MLIGKFVQYVVIQGVHKSISDVGLAHTVSERRGAELGLHPADHIPTLSGTPTAQVTVET